MSDSRKYSLNNSVFAKRFRSVRHSPNMPEPSWLRKAGTRGVLIPAIRSDSMLGTIGRREVLVVTPDAPWWQVRRAYRVGHYGNSETLFDCVYPSSFPASDTHAFLVRNGKRAVGMAVVRSRMCSREAWLGTVEKGERQLWTVTFVWVLDSQRKQGIAEALVETICEYFRVGAREIGWLKPLTESGECLARHLCPVEYWGA